MDEISLLREVLPDHPLPPPSELSARRRRLVAEIRHSGQPRPRLGQRRRAAVTGLGLAAASGLAVALALTIASPGKPVAPNRSITMPPAQLSAARFLRSAASTRPDLTSRPGMLVYAEELQWDGSPKPRVERFWLSDDGTRPGLIEVRNPATGQWAPLSRLSACHNGMLHIWVRGDPGHADESCNSDPFGHKLPSTAAALNTYVNSQPGDGAPHWHKILDAVSPLAIEFNPQTRAALFNLLAAQPQARLNREVLRVPGHPSTVAVEFTWPGGRSRTDLVFDAQTHEYLGEVDHEPASGPVAFGQLILQAGTVSNPGQLP